MKTESGYTKSAKGAYYAIIILTVLVALLAIKANSQTIGIGTGYTSRGVVPLLVSYSYDKVGGYIRIADQQHQYNEYVTPPEERDEYSLGISYNIHERVMLLADIGKGTRTEYFYTVTNYKTYIDLTKTNLITFGFGFNALLYKGERIDVGVSSIFSTFTTLNSFVIIRLDLTK